MFKPRVLKIAALIITGYAVLVLPGFFWPAYLDSPASIVTLVPLLSVYVFHKVGVPGLLEHNGLCGWGWCSPTAFGWAFAAVFWVMAVWLAAWGIAALSNRRDWRRGSDDPDARWR